MRLHRACRATHNTRLLHHREPHRSPSLILQRNDAMNSNPITAQLEIDLNALLSDTDSTTSEKLDQISQAFIRVTNQLEDKVRILSQVVCTPEVFAARKRPGIREESSRFIKAYELPACWVHGVKENQEKLAIRGCPCQQSRQRTSRQPCSASCARAGHHHDRSPQLRSRRSPHTSYTKQ